MREQYVMKGYGIATESDDTIILEKTLIGHTLTKWVVAIVFFPLGCIGFIKQSVSLVIDAPPTVEPTASDKFADLAKLGQLRKDGILTEEEFQAKKAKLLL